MCRYLFMSLQSQLQLDPELEKYEKLFLTFSEKCIANSIRWNCWFSSLLLECDLGWLIGRTVLIDKLMEKALKFKISNIPEKEAEEKHQRVFK